MPGFDTYTQLRQAEDVEDVIYNISPIDNPVASMSRTIRATAKIHEWTEDVLAAAGSNKKVEGAAAGADTSVPVLEKFSYCQIMDKVAEVTGTLESVDKHGRDSEMGYQLEKRYGELANDEELAIVGAPGGVRQVGAAGTGAVAREMKSLHTMLDTTTQVPGLTAGTLGVVIDAAAFTTIVQLEQGLLDAHLKTFSFGGNPKYLFVNPSRVRHINRFAYSAGRTRQIANEKTLVNVIDLYISSYGELDVVLDRQQDNCLLLLDFEYLATPVLRATADWAIAKQGDSDKRQILRESSFAVLNSKAHAMVDNVPAALT